MQRYKRNKSNKNSTKLEGKMKSELCTNRVPCDCHTIGNKIKRKTENMKDGSLVYVKKNGQSAQWAHWTAAIAI